jgi:nitroreductase
MEAIEAINTRRSIRTFLDQEVPADVIGKILDAGLRAPSAGNCQPWRFIVVTDRAKMKLFDPQFHQPCVENAPAIIVVCTNPHDTWERYDEQADYHKLDAAAATENMLLAAHAMGLGAVWVGAFSPRDTRKALNIPAHWQVITLIPLGYYRDADNPDRAPRRALSKISFMNDANTPFTA